MTRERKVSWGKGRLMDMWIFRLGSAGREMEAGRGVTGDKAVVVERFEVL